MRRLAIAAMMAVFLCLRVFSAADPEKEGKKRWLPTSPRPSRSAFRLNPAK